MSESNPFCAWFAGPKSENGEAFQSTIRRILEDYHYWRRNYFPEDGVVIDSAAKRGHEEFQDAFEDRLMELLALLKGDFPFYSPRYFAHMLSEQTLPSIAGYFAGMLFNPNNVTSEAAPVTTRLELEVAGMIARMLGHGHESWAHLTSGGTVANFEALWVARSVKYLPHATRDMCKKLGVECEWEKRSDKELLRLSPAEALREYERSFESYVAQSKNPREATVSAIEAYLGSPFTVAQAGIGSITQALGSRPVLLAPESQHYCLLKALDLLGLGRNNMVPVAVDSNFRMDVIDLDRKLDEVESRGDHVLAVVCVVGSTEEGAVDPVDQILDLRARREQADQPSFWIHADAAWGGYLRTMVFPQRLGLGDPEVQVKVGEEVRSLRLEFPQVSTCDALERLGECDSIAIDPHKLGYVPYPVGAICYKSDRVKPIARQHAPYLEEAPLSPSSERKSSSIGVYILEGSKPGAAAACAWLSHKCIPLDNQGHGLLMQETVRNACELHTLLERYSELAGPQPTQAVCLCPPGSNIACFAFRGARTPVGLCDLNQRNRAIFARLSLPSGPSTKVYEQQYFVSRTHLSSNRYGPASVAQFLKRLEVTQEDYDQNGVFLLRSTLMNPFLTEAKRKGRYFVSEFVSHLYALANEIWGA